MRWVNISDPSKRSIGFALRDQADTIGDAVFLRDEEQSYTYAEANRAANSYAAGLHELGVRGGDVVALLMENSLDFPLLTLGINKLGAAWTPSNTSYRGDWLRSTFEDGGADILVADAELLPRLGELGVLPFKHLVVRGEPTCDPPPGVAVTTLAELRAEPTEPSSVVEASALGAVMWTSGTTGRSKGVMQSHSTWLSCAEVIARGRDTASGDVFYCCVPMYNSGGWVLNVYNALVTGTTCAIDRQFSATRFWDRCRLLGATQIFTLGAMHMYLLQQPEQPDDRDNPVRVAGLIPIPQEASAVFRERFGVDYVWQGFGQSEVMPWSITYRGRDYKPGSAGIPREDLEVRALDNDDYEVPVGEVGEICVRPRRPDVMFSGYYRQPEATLRAFRNLWYHSGDLGRFDDDGELYFVDRKADFMRYKGRNISSFDLENVAGRHPAVSEVAAHGVPAGELDVEDEVKLCVVIREDHSVTAEELARFINDNAPYFFVPRYIEFLEDLPHTPTGKVQKYLLRKRGVTDGTWDRVAAGFSVVR